MKKLLILIPVVLISIFVISQNTKGKVMPATDSVYDYSVNDIDGNEVHLSDYEGKVLLIVNTASECGFTSQYEGLQELYEQHKDDGLVVLGFPCNQFGGQEPGSSEEIKNFCSSKFSVTFPLFEKIDVNGDNAAPLYKYLKSEQSGLITDDIKWNFTKFLIDRNGQPVERFAPTTKPEKIESHIKKMI
jgi:glutathione peroxidase